MRKQKEVTRTLEEAHKTVGMLLDALGKGQDFAKMANAFSECPSGGNGGDLNLFGPGQMVPEFEEAAYKLEIGKFSGAVESSTGVHIIKRTELVQKQAVDDCCNVVRTDKRGKKVSG